jgi:DNA helicase HerA-like ATPase
LKHAIPTEVLRHHTAILGKTGSGKTSTEKLAVEQVVDEGYRVCILDTLKSDWWGITSSASGKSEGLPFKILGGPRGHVPLHSSAGKVIGQLVGSGKLPLSIVDVADFEPGGVQRFFVDFAQALWKNAKGVVYLVIEEAHEIAPKERAGFGAENWRSLAVSGGDVQGRTMTDTITR